MCTRKHALLSLFIALLGLALATTPNVAHADEPTPAPNHGTCINCHENLYFLHDTGKWFCLKDAPMTCVDCHGGDPTATTQEKAHANRAAHPVINENILKCQECHPDKSVERVQLFREVAGISPVSVAAAYVPVAASSMVPATGQEQPSSILLWLGGSFTLSMLVVLVLIVFLRRSVSRQTRQYKLKIKP